MTQSDLQPSDTSLRIGVFGCGFTTWELVVRLVRAGVRVTDCVTIDHVEATRQAASGFMDLGPRMSELGIEVLTVESYGLATDRDRFRVSDLGLDVGFCVGWQRLLPDWCLESVRCGIFGMHGSSQLLPHGRGRSPMNWSLLLGKDVFYTHLFKYDPGVDSGPVVGVQAFDINAWDTVHTLHLKNVVAMSQLCREHLEAILNGSVELCPQSEEGVSYYPKRTDKDGRIFWGDSTTDLYNLVRAVTRPFPGAWSYRDLSSGEKIRIWEAVPFDSRIEWPGCRSGEIVEVFEDGSFIAKTGDGSLHVREYSGNRFSLDDVGLGFEDGPEAREIYGDLPA